MAIDRKTEYVRILPIAARHGVDPAFILSIRIAEDGRPGREFGVLSVDAPTYEEQCAVACNSVAHRIFDMCTSERPDHAFTFSRGRLSYSDWFIQAFAHTWAPPHVSNDPTQMNANWYNNVKAIYLSVRSEGL